MHSGLLEQAVELLRLVDVDLQLALRIGQEAGEGTAELGAEGRVDGHGVLDAQGGFEAGVAVEFDLGVEHLAGVPGRLFGRQQEGCAAHADVEQAQLLRGAAAIDGCDLGHRRT